MFSLKGELIVEIPMDDNQTQGVEDLTPKSEISIEDLKIGYIFPNPTTGIIRFTTNKEVEAIVQIRNIQGQLIFTNQMNLNGESSLNITNVPTGIYFIVIKDSESGKTLSSQKVMKQ